MRFFLLMAAYGIVVIVLETTVLSGWPTRVLRLDLVIPAVAALAFYQEKWQALPVIIFLGMMMDIASSAPFGMSLLSYLLIYGMVRMIIAKISFQDGVGLLFWMAMISLFDKCVCALVLLVSRGDLFAPGLIVSLAPAQALMDAALGLLLVPLLVKYWDLSWSRLFPPKNLVMR